MIKLLKMLYNSLYYIEKKKEKKKKTCGSSAATQATYFPHSMYAIQSVCSAMLLYYFMRLGTGKLEAGFNLGAKLLQS